MTVAGSILSACSGGGESDGATSTTAATVPAAAAVPDAESSPTTTARSRPSLTPLDVSLTIGSDDLGVQAQLVGDVAAAGDPFGDFAVCSGHAAQIGSYLVGVGSATGSVRWASVATADRVLGAGAYDADVRLELGSGETIDAIGSLTLASGLASGSFEATTVDGALVAGEFVCAGGSPAITGAAGTVTGLVEVVALLQRGPAERVVSAVSDDADVVACPLGAGGVPRLVEIFGDARIGSLTAFGLDRTGSEAGVLALSAGGTSYRADDVAIVRADDGRAGTFSAVTADAVSIDGAFSCTER